MVGCGENTKNSCKAGSTAYTLKWWLVFGTRIMLALMILIFKASQCSWLEVEAHSSSTDKSKILLESLSLVMGVNTRRGSLLLPLILALWWHVSWISLARRRRGHRLRETLSRTVPRAWHRRYVALSHHHLLVHRGLLLLPRRHCLLCSLRGLLVGSLPHLLPLPFSRVDVSHQAGLTTGTWSLTASHVEQRLSSHTSHVFLIPC